MPSSTATSPGPAVRCCSVVTATESVLMVAGTEQRISSIGRSAPGQWTSRCDACALVPVDQARQVNQPMTEKTASKRMITQAVYAPIVPSQVICELIGGGVAERYPSLHFSLVEFNAHWLSSLVGAMDKCWITGIGQDPDWWLGRWDDSRPDSPTS